MRLLRTCHVRQGEDYAGTAADACRLSTTLARQVMLAVQAGQRRGPATTAEAVSGVRQRGDGGGARGWGRGSRERGGQGRGDGQGRWACHLSAVACLAGLTCHQACVRPGMGAKGWVCARSCERGDQGSGRWGGAQVGVRAGLGLPAWCEVQWVV